jgi:hypothetical protein
MNKYYDLFIIIIAIAIAIIIIGTVERKEADSNQTCKPVAPLATHFAIKSAQALASLYVWEIRTTQFLDSSSLMISTRRTTPYL